MTIHPRPNLRRETRLSLDGTWAFALDPEDAGEREGWFRGQRHWPLQITVPFPWESSASGVGPPAPDHHVRNLDAPGGGIGWYRREVEVPDDWAGERLWLVVGAAYWHTRVWVDGEFVGEHDGGYDPFDLDLTDFVCGRRRFALVIRVAAPADPDEYPHGKNVRYWYTRSSGIWQSVFLEPRPPTHVSWLGVRTDPGTGGVELRVETSSLVRTNVDLRAEVLRGGVVVAATGRPLAVAAGRSSHAVSLVVEKPRLWSVDDPALYDVRVRLSPTACRGQAADRLCDTVESTVGFRSVGFDRPADGGPRRFTLNGTPTLIRCVMSQGYHPDGILAYPDEAVIRADLEAAKRLGFNMVRLHVKLEDPRLLALADELGMLLWCEPPNFLTPSAEARARWERTWRAMLRRDANHPSIVLWAMFIESWGLGVNQFGFGAATRRFADDPEAQAWVEEMYRLGKALDPTRPIIENSTSEGDHTIAEVNDIHVFPSVYGSLDREVATAVEELIANAHSGSTHNFAPGYRQADQPLMVSSMACWASVDGVETSWPLHVFINELRSRERICGYGWVQLYDVEWEQTGLLTYDRRAKEFGYEVTDLNAEDVLVVGGALARDAAAGEVVPIRLGLAHASARHWDRLVVRASIEGLDDRGKAVRSDPLICERSTWIDRPAVVDLGVIEVRAPDAPFAGRVRLEALDDQDAVVARTFVHLATDAPDSESIPAASVELPLDAWRSGPPGDGESVTVGSSIGRMTARTLTVTFRTPDCPDEHRALLSFCAELAIDDGHAGQTTADVRRHAVQVLVDGHLVGTVQAPRMRADSRGTLSIVHPEGFGTYGELVVVPLGFPARAGAVQTLTLRSVAAGARVVVFGRRLGAIPAEPRMLLRADLETGQSERRTGRG